MARLEPPACRRRRHGNFTQRFCTSLLTRSPVGRVNAWATLPALDCALLLVDLMQKEEPTIVTVWPRGLLRTPEGGTVPGGEDEVTGDMCNVCLEPLTTRADVVELPSCHHTFHTRCVEGETQCPLCRHPITWEDVALVMAPWVSVDWPVGRLSKCPTTSVVGRRMVAVRCDIQALMRGGSTHVDTTDCLVYNIGLRGLLNACADHAYMAASLDDELFQYRYEALHLGVLLHTEDECRLVDTLLACHVQHLMAVRKEQSS